MCATVDGRENNIMSPILDEDSSAEKGFNTGHGNGRKTTRASHRKRKKQKDMERSTDQEGANSGREDG